MRWLLGLLAVLVGGGVALTAQLRILNEAPSEEAIGFPSAEIDTLIREMDSRGEPTLRLVEGGSYNVNIRRIAGTETALLHPTTTDVYVVREGSGTLVTGGVLVDADGQPVDGTRGASIRGGTEQVVGVGDVVFIPAGVAHGFRETDGITWFNIRFDADR